MKQGTSLGISFLSPCRGGIYDARPPRLRDLARDGGQARHCGLPWRDIVGT